MHSSTRDLAGYQLIRLREYGVWRDIDTYRPLPPLARTGRYHYMTGALYRHARDKLKADVRVTSSRSECKLFDPTQGEDKITRITILQSRFNSSQKTALRFSSSSGMPFNRELSRSVEGHYGQGRSRDKIA